MNMKTLHVVELFAGVGGFRIGLERAAKKVPGKSYELLMGQSVGACFKIYTTCSMDVHRDFLQEGQKEAC